jgi:hypothetical protein
MTHVDYEMKKYEEKKFWQSIKEYTIAATICNVIVALIAAVAFIK